MDPTTPVDGGDATPATDPATPAEETTEEATA